LERTTMEEEDLIRLLKKLIGIPSSVNDGPEIYDFSAEYLEKKGLEVTTQTLKNPYIQYNDFNNIYARIGNGKGPKIMLNCHLDTVGKGEGWFFDPYDAEEKEGNIFGLGAADMKAGCAVAMMAMVHMGRKFRDLNGELFFSGVFGEEAPYSLGTDTLLKEHDLDDFDLIIVTEPSPVVAINDYCITHRRLHKAKYPVVITGAEGRVLFEIDVHGKSSHASHPSMGINALHAASQIITELTRFDIYSSIKMGRGHYCVINMEGGSQNFTVPSFCRIHVNRQLTMGETEEMVTREIDSIIRSLNLKSKVVVRKRYSPGTEIEYRPYISEGGKYLDAFIDHIPIRPYGKGKERKKKCIFTTSSVGDFNLFGTRTKAPVAIFGPGGANIHSPNEFVYRDQTIRTFELIVRFLERVYGEGVDGK